MNLSMRRVMASNHGLVTRGQARDCGLTTSDVNHLIRNGSLVVVRRGVYADGQAWAALDPGRGRHQLRTRAAIKTMQRGYVVSHDSSAYEHDLEILEPPVEHVHITRPGSTAAWTRAGVKHHLARFTREQVVERNGLQVLDLARTAVDIARELGPPYGEVACDAVLRRGVSRTRLEAAYAAMECWPHIKRVRAAVAFADPGAQNVAETLGRMLVAEALGSEPIETQFPVPLDTGSVAWCDLLVGRHAFEVNGKIKLMGPSEGGVASAPAHEVVWAQQRRLRAVERAGLGASPIIWADFWPPYRAKAIIRIREEYAATVARLGDRVPEHLVRQAHQIRARRGA